MERIHLIVHGRVQGVFFRAHTQERGHKLGLSGWVRNLPDGAVEAVAEGPREALEQFLAWCRQGPPAARVDAVDVSWEEPEGMAGSFRITP